MSTSTDDLVALGSPGERRFYPRIAPSRPIYIPFGGNNLAMLLNLGENGLLVSTPSGLDLNSVFRVSLRLHGLAKPIEVHVRTVWTTESTKRSGIQLLDLSEHDREQLRKWQALDSRKKNAGNNLEENSEKKSAAKPEQEEDHVAPRPTPLAQREKTPLAARIPQPPPIPAYLAPMPPTEPLRNTHLDSLLSRSPQVSRRRERKSKAPALAACTVLAAVVCFAVALGSRPDLFAKLRDHLATITDRSAVIGAPKPATSPELAEAQPSGQLEAQAQPDANPQVAPDPQAPSGAAPLHSTQIPALSSSVVRANQLPITPPPSQRPGLRFSLAKLKSPVGANNGPFPLEPNEIPAPVSDTAQPATVAKQLNAQAPAHLTDSLASVSPAAAPAPPAALPVKSAITGSIENTTPRTSSIATVQPQTTPSPTTTRSTWSSGPPISAGRTSFFRSRSDSVWKSDPVVHMDADPHPLIEITAPRSLTASYVALSGERVLDSPTLTMHIQRSVLVPGDHWLWNTHKKVALGELTSRLDPQISRLATTSGTITVQATIDKDGRVTNLKPLNGSFAFLPSVSKAIREWRYEPTYLDNKPVETQAQIELDFHPPARR